MDRNKLEQLLKANHADAFRWASQCCHYNPHDAEEVLQITYLKIADGKARFNDKAAFKTWLFAVVRNTALDYLHRRVKFENLEQVQFLANDETVPERQEYRRLLALLPDRQRQVLLLVFYHDMTLAEVALITGLHIGTVRTHYSRGKTALRTLIKKERV